MCFFKQLIFSMTSTVTQWEQIAEIQKQWMDFLSEFFEKPSAPSCIAHTHITDTETHRICLESSCNRFFFRIKNEFLGFADYLFFFQVCQINNAYTHLPLWDSMKLIVDRHSRSPFVPKSYVSVFRIIVPIVWQQWSLKKIKKFCRPTKKHTGTKKNLLSLFS